MTVVKVSISEFRKNIREYINNILNDKVRIIIYKHKKPVVAVSPVISDYKDDMERCEQCGQVVGEVLND